MSATGTEHATELDLKAISAVNEYWDEARNLYSPFESGQLTGEFNTAGSTWGDLLRILLTESGRQAQ